MAGNSAEPGRTVSSKIIAILQAFTSGGAHSLTEITHLTGLPMSTVHRLVTELTAGGLLERTDDARYRVGLPLRVMGSLPAPPPSTGEWARQAIEDLSAAVHRDVRLGFFEDLDVAFVEKVVGQQGVCVFCGAAALPAHATALGKALLAFSPPGTVDRVIARGLKRYTAYTRTTADRLRRSLAEIRLSCIALSRWELQLGASGVAAPVFGAGGRVLAAVEVRVRDACTDLPRVQPALLVAARNLSRELAMSGPFRGESSGSSRWAARPMDAPDAAHLACLIPRRHAFQSPFRMGDLEAPRCATYARTRGCVVSSGSAAASHCAPEGCHGTAGRV